MADNIYFLCPNCGKLLRKLKAIKEEVKEIIMYPESGRIGLVYYHPDEEVRVSEKFMTVKFPCGYEVKGKAEDFIVVILEERKILVPIGQYWLKNKKKFREMAKKLKLKLLFE